MVNIQKLPLAKDQYYAVAQKKTHIFLHHTAGGSVTGAFAQWQNTKERVACPYIIERTGQVYECFDPRYWAYALGVKGATWLEKASIHIEIVAYGGLTKKGKDYLTYTNRKIPVDDVQVLDPAWRGSSYFQAYTNEQILSLKDLLKKLYMDFSIKPKPVPDFYQYRDWTKLPSGVWSHTTVRKDKQDIYPDLRLRKMLQTL